jgi:TPR repeat protein
MLTTTGSSWPARLITIIALLIAQSSSAGAAESKIHDCDRLAGAPQDPDRVTDGVPSNNIDTTRAISACAQAVRSDPTNRRFQFEYGRALAAANRYAEAMQWYRKVADQGSRVAQVNIGVMYEKGHGVTQNYTEAMKWYRKAADQGLATAQANIGALYVNGTGVPQNYAEAARWLRMAANQGNATAQANLAKLCNSKAIENSEICREQKAAAEEQENIFLEQELQKIREDYKQEREKMTNPRATTECTINYSHSYTTAEDCSIAIAGSLIMTAFKRHVIRLMLSGADSIIRKCADKVRQTIPGKSEPEYMNICDSLLSEVCQPPLYGEAHMAMCARRCALRGGLTC